MTDQEYKDYTYGFTGWKAVPEGEDRDKWNEREYQRFDPMDYAEHMYNGGTTNSYFNP